MRKSVSDTFANGEYDVVMSTIPQSVCVHGGCGPSHVAATFLLRAARSAFRRAARATEGTSMFARFHPAWICEESVLSCPKRFDKVFGY